MITVWRRVRGKQPPFAGVADGLLSASAAIRVAAVDSLVELLRGRHSLGSLVAKINPRVIACCGDVDSAVGVAAIRCASALATQELLADEGFNTVAYLIWHPDLERRVAAAAFVNLHILGMPVFDPVECAMQASDRFLRIVTLVDFVIEYAPRLVDQILERMVGSFWGRASCLQDWGAFARLALPGDLCLDGTQHNVLAHLMEASARFAIGDVLASRFLANEVARSALDAFNAAALQLAPRVPELLDAYLEPDAVTPCAALWMTAFARAAHAKGNAR